MGIVEDLLNKNRLKKALLSNEMVTKEFEVGKKDFISALASFESSNFKWATIQAYYAIFHASRALLYKSGYREESHTALKLSIKELYVTNGKLPRLVYDTLERGMDLREMAETLIWNLHWQVPFLCSNIQKGCVQYGSKKTNGKSFS